ncbi:MAG: VOC family protein [Taibaiella sp.]|nr:VOC family protein [Taibaiella sp.]
MASRTHAINWFEIPVSDFDRAKRFYETILASSMQERQVNTARMAFFQFDVKEEGRGGAIVYDPEFYTPSDNGTLIYLNCNPDLQKVIDRVIGAGGSIIQPSTPVAVTQDWGSWALIRDTEGNRIALHAAK